MVDFTEVIPRDTILTASNSNHGVPCVVQLLLCSLSLNSGWLHYSCAARHNKTIKFISFKNLVIVFIFDVEEVLHGYDPLLGEVRIILHPCCPSYNLFAFLRCRFSNKAYAVLPVRFNCCELWRCELIKSSCQEKCILWVLKVLNSLASKISGSRSKLLLHQLSFRCLFTSTLLWNYSRSRSSLSCVRCLSATHITIQWFLKL